MHRFRKKSETKQTPISIPTHSERNINSEPLPELPPTNDFRTSAILPDLSRRFSLLRSSTGEPVTFEEYKSRFAEQRARGAESQINEEEEPEDMIFATIGRFRSRHAVSQASSDSIEGSGSRQSVVSSATVTSSVAPSMTSSTPSGRSTKRYSNNLFGSGKFRDYTYFRSVAKQQNPGASPLTSTDTSSSLRGRSSAPTITESIRSTSPEGILSPPPRQANENGSSVQSAPLIPPAPYADSSTITDQNPGKASPTPVMRQESIVIAEPMKEIEEEDEDEDNEEEVEENDDKILMPRSPAGGRAGTEQSRHGPEGGINNRNEPGNFKHKTVKLTSTSQRDVEPSQSSAPFEPGMAISSDSRPPSAAQVRGASPISSRIAPGYIPGMPRPMTPRDYDLDEQRSHSTTPRATSPTSSLFPDATSPEKPPSGPMRRGSTSSNARQSPRPASPHSSSPLFLQRSTNGRFTPDSSQRSGDTFTLDPDNPLSILSRRRPASPLANPVYQSIAMSSRPTTPSNITWTIGSNQNNGSAKHGTGHGRNESWASDGSFGAVESSKVRVQFRSPALLDSPSIDQGQQNAAAVSSQNSSEPNRPPSSNSGINLESPSLTPSRLGRSPTPTQSHSRSPTSPTLDMPSKNNSRPASKQHGHSNSFSASPFSAIFSPLVNSSRSSVESEGSSYHSTEGETKDRTLVLFMDADPQPAWYDVNLSHSQDYSTGDEEGDSEDIVTRCTGLKKPDFVAIQEKLVSVALARSSSGEGRDRAPSVRRRRPSTSQSNYSINNRDRVSSPQPHSRAPSPTPTPTPRQLLNSVVDSIETPQEFPQPTSLTIPSQSVSGSAEVSPTTRRNRDLAQILFGSGDEPLQQNPPTLRSGTPINSSPMVSPPSPHQDVEEPRTAVSPPASPYFLKRNPSAAKIPQTLQDEEKLTKEVQQRIDAATQMLKKSPANGSAGDPPTIRKRVNPQQISTPQLISSSTSVNVIPLPTPSESSHNSTTSSKMSRFRRLRGSLRVKPNLTLEESTQLQATSPSTVQTATYGSNKLKAPATASESRFKLPLPSPPASATPGLRGFMARFRAKSRTTPAEAYPAIPPAPMSAPLMPQATESPPQTMMLSRKSQYREKFEQPQASPDMPPEPPTEVPVAPSPALRIPAIHTSHPSTDTTESLKALFVAASNLGLDQGELNALVARSHSSSSRSTDWTLLSSKNPSPASSRQTTQEDSAGVDNTVPSTRSSQPIVIDPLPTAEDLGSRFALTDPTVAKERSSIDGSPDRDTPQSQLQHSTSVSTVRRRSVRKSDSGRRPREGLTEHNPVIRRTIIVPSELPPNFDLASLISKANSRNRRASAASISVRSLQERAPTPPPSKSPTGRRYSVDEPPPVPLLPNAVSNPYIYSATNAINASQSQLDILAPSSRAPTPYDQPRRAETGRYDFLSGASLAGDDAVPENSQQLQQGEGFDTVEPGVPALELLEMANGETIWQIVNGLRNDDDDDDLYPARTSFASEYSARDNEDASISGLQVFVKGHERNTSKGSSNSLSRKKHPQGQSRPETKVFYSSSAHIGRLIENLSQGMDAGSFNFLPTRHIHDSSHSKSSSVSTTATGTTDGAQWSMEDKVDHLLKIINTPPKAA